MSRDSAWTAYNDVIFDNFSTIAVAYGLLHPFVAVMAKEEMGNMTTPSVKKTIEIILPSFSTDTHLFLSARKIETSHQCSGDHRSTIGPFKVRYCN